MMKDTPSLIIPPSAFGRRPPSRSGFRLSPLLLRRHRLGRDAEALADFVGVEGVALKQSGDEVCDLGAARVNDLAGALHLRVDDVAGGVLDAVEERLAVRVFGLAEVYGAERAHAELRDHAARY